MATVATPSLRVLRGYRLWLPDLQLGLQNLMLHRLRTLLTMLGMIFGVAAVVSMLSIGAGARQKVMAFIETAADPGLFRCQVAGALLAIETIVGVKVVGIVSPTIASSRTPLRRQTNPVAVIASAFFRRVFANSPITSLLAVNLTRATIGIGSTRLNTTWLSTRAWVMSVPAATTTTEGAITTRRRSQSGIRNDTKPCMITWPAMTPTMELEKPEANRASINRPAAPSPRSGAKV